MRHLDAFEFRDFTACAAQWWEPAALPSEQGPVVGSDGTVRTAEAEPISPG